MAPQPSVPLAANILGMIGVLCWCVQLIPQIWRNYRTKSTEGLPASMMFIWSVSAVPFSIYAIVQRSAIALQIQPQCLCAFCAISWGQCLFYGRKWPATKAVLTTIALLLVCAAAELGFVLPIRLAYSKGISWPVTTMGLLAIILLIAGFMPVPFELLKRRGRVIGIDFVFLFIDWCGAFFSLMALVAQVEFDVLFGCLYVVCCGIEMGIAISHLIWMYRTRYIRRRAKEAGMDFDRFPEAVEWQSGGIGVRWEAVKRRMRLSEKIGVEGVEVKVTERKNSVV
ncbi:PQ loop repeat protein-like protein [Clohesyomyces aquaticus]|uniref:PQ loop repeat protein-like protein n=1 Tax=Clohesyomyces aquaticus TaxID=1231657 RepID=A0A1Y2A6X7_9PLEO|nr:PQ loop repeat protein-like protein [Clohesyomyces aquaticus]